MSNQDPPPAYRSLYDIEHARRCRIAEQNQHLAEIIEDDNMASICEPCRVPPECRTPIKPGSHFAAAAYRDGSEDEYANRMKARYGGEW